MGRFKVNRTDLKVPASGAMMRRAVRRHVACPTVFVAALVAGAGSAKAQLAPGYSGSPGVQYAGHDEVWQEIIVYAGCLASTRQNDAWALLRNVSGSREEAQHLRQMQNRAGCRVDIENVRMPASMIRGAVAEALYRRRTPVPTDLRWSGAAEGDARTLSDAARCYVSTHAEEARRIVEGTRPGGQAEVDAMNAAMIRFRACVPADVRRRPFGLTQVRFRIAEALLRMSPAQAQ